MAELNVGLINPFFESCITVLKNYNTNVKVGKPYVKTAAFDAESVIIMIGVTGEIRGQVILGIPDENALKIANSMMALMMPGFSTTELDEIALSAVSEFSNQMMGNAGVIFSNKNIGIDITPPAMARGDVKFELAAKNICVPMLDENNNVFLEIDISLRDM